MSLTSIKFKTATVENLEEFNRNISAEIPSSTTLSKQAFQLEKNNSSSSLPLQLQILKSPRLLAPIQMMSFLLQAEGIQIPDLQMWRNNAMFDKGSPNEPLQLQHSWLPSNPTFDSPSKSPGFDSSKENQAPGVGKSLVLRKSLVPNTSFRSNSVASKSQGKPLRVLLKDESEDRCEESKIDAEIEVIQREVAVLLSRLDVLRLRKAEIANEKVESIGNNVESVEKTKKKKSIVSRNYEEAKARLRRRGFSLVASMAAQSTRQARRKSIQATEEEKEAKVRNSTTELQSTPSRKKSIFSSTLQYLKEDKVTKQRGGRSLSLEPGLPGEAIQESERQLTTVGSNKESGFLSAIQPKKIHNGVKCVGNKKQAVKNGERVIASRYNQTFSQIIANQQLMKQGKRSLPEDDVADVYCGHSAENSGAFQHEMGLNQLTETRRVKKRWEIPSEEIIHEIRTNIYGNQR